MNALDNLIKEYVDQFETNFKSDSKYLEYLEKMNIVNLNNVTEDNVKNMVKPYLYNWGKMHRFLGQKKLAGWELKIAEQIRLNSTLLNSYKQRNIVKSNLTDIETGIKQCYSSLFKIVGKIGAGKLLHFLCPAFFPPWDNPIANAISNEKVFLPHRFYRQPYKYNFNNFSKMTDKEKAEAYIERMQRKEENLVNKSAEEYFCFMKVIQNFINNHINILSDLALKYDKSVIKITDQCFWWGATRRPLYLFFK